MHSNSSDISLGRFADVSFTASVTALGAMSFSLSDFLTFSLVSHLPLTFCTSEPALVYELLSDNDYRPGP